jgi:hypothetical protein
MLRERSVDVIEESAPLVPTLHAVDVLGWPPAPTITEIETSEESIGRVIMPDLKPPAPPPEPAWVSLSASPPDPPPPTTKYLIS